jgi:predicted transcriptional regulator
MNTVANLDTLALKKLAQLPAVKSVVKTPVNLSPGERKIWLILQKHGPLTLGEIDEKLNESEESRFNISAKLTTMVGKGLVSRPGSRICSVARRMVFFYKAESSALRKAPKTAYIKARHEHFPTANDLEVFSRDMKILLLSANQQGARISPTVRKILKWIEDGAGRMRPRDLQKTTKPSNK